MHDPTNRRDFLRASGALALALGALGAQKAPAAKEPEPEPKPQEPKKPEKTNPLVVGVMGDWTLNAGKAYPPSGTLEPKDVRSDGSVDLYGNMRTELLEETGLEVRVLELIEVFDRIYVETTAGSEAKRGPRFHYVIVDYLCERIRGEAVAGSDVTDVAFAKEEELEAYGLTETALRILRKAFAIERVRAAASGKRKEI